MKKIRLFSILILLLVNSMSYSQVIISQYYEGASNNKWIEVTNIGADRDMATNPVSLMMIGGSAAKDVTACKSSRVYTFKTGTWISGTSKLVKHGSAVLPAGLVADTATNVLAFNGAFDVVFLSDSANTDTLVSWEARLDVVGEVIANMTTSNDIQDISLVRNASVLSTNIVYTASEWTEYSLDAVNAATGLVTEKLGVHIFGTAPNIALYPNTLAGFSYNIGEGPSAEQIFEVTGTNLTEGITLTAPEHYEISLETGTNFGATQFLAQTDGTVPATQIFVRLKTDLSAAVYNEDITFNSLGATVRTLNCVGQVFDPLAPVALPYLRDFETGDATSDFWSNKAVSDVNHQWEINSLAGNEFIQMSNFTNPVYDNAEAWYVSPPFDVVGKDLVVFQFDYAVYELANGHLSVLISNDYDGISDPSVQGTWEDITPEFTVDNYYNFTTTGEIDITAYSTAPATIAFIFADASNTAEGNTWRIDNISVEAPIDLVITNPSTSTITILNPQIEFNVTNFSLSPEGTSEGDGYIKYSVTDNGIMSPNVSLYNTAPIEMSCILNHEYLVQMWLVDNDGNPIVPNVVASVLFTVTTLEGLADNLSASYTVYPNPVVKTLNVENHNYTSIRIYNAAGSIVKDIPNSSDNIISVDVSDLVSGLYFIELKSKTGVSTQKFVK